MKLLLLRHGPAGDRKTWAAEGKSDALRPLTAKGRRKTERAAAGLVRALPSIDRVASSPLKRARQTAEIAAARYGLKPELVEELAQDSDVSRLVKKLASFPPFQTVALVGHEPGLSRLAAALTGGGRLE